jgi:hypothetical protein
MRKHSPLAGENWTMERLKTFIGGVAVSAVRTPPLSNRERFRRRLYASAHRVAVKDEAYETYRVATELLIESMWMEDLVSVPSHSAVHASALFEVTAWASEILHGKPLFKYKWLDSNRYNTGHGIKKQLIQKLLEIFGLQTSLKMISKIANLILAAPIHTLPESEFDKFGNDLYDDYQNSALVSIEYICKIRMEMNPSHPWRSTYQGQPDRNMVASI